eukprot:TRINITY_DN21790_c0_g2_i1.p1 TRINITY_DN21790_c0_g2~~TRINITY_DN21790_c0_g2_i1.p1  ORF type:complete len:344 (+),score=62.56 TRINITY_DN21790_c0_g2_i1:136-1167(+)
METGGCGDAGAGGVASNSEVGTLGRATTVGGSPVSVPVAAETGFPIAATPSSATTAGRFSAGNALLDGNDLTSLREVLSRFKTLDKDVVSEELKTLERPLDTGLIQNRVSEYSKLEGALGTRLGGHLIANYEGFARGMQYVEQVDLEFAYIRVKIKNSRRRLETADSALGQGGLYVARQRRRSERIRAVLEFSSELQTLLAARQRMKQLAADEKYHDAISLNARVLHMVRSERFQAQGSDLVGALGDDIRSHLEETKQRLRERSQRAAAIAEVKFDADAYEEILEALVAAGIAEGAITAEDLPVAAVEPPLPESPKVREELGPLTPATSRPLLFARDSAARKL